jgi:hypothetical protein
MINRFRAAYSHHAFPIDDSNELFLIDHKSLHRGRNDLELTNVRPTENHVYLFNPNQVPVYVNIFPDNAFLNPDGSQCRQCECVFFPEECNADDWVLFVEMKYPFNVGIAFGDGTRYPDNMIDQIVQTVGHLRNKGVILPDKRVMALAAFPTLIADFSESFFTGPRNMHDILEKYNIAIRPKNSVRIRSAKNIKF